MRRRFPGARSSRSKAWETCVQAAGPTSGRWGLSAGRGWGPRGWELNGWVATSLQSLDMSESARSGSEAQQRYNPAEIEPKWQARWDADERLYAAGAHRSEERPVGTER